MCSAGPLCARSGSGGAVVRGALSPQCEVAQI